MRLKLKVVSTLVLMTIFIAACGAGTEQSAADDVDSLMTAAVGTMVSSLFETQTAMVTPATDTPVPTMTLQPSPTPYPTTTPQLLPSPTFIFYTATLSLSTPGTPTVTGTLPTPTVNSNALAYGCNNLAFIRDVNIPPGTVLKRKEEFTKTWKVQNTGTCNWMYQYRLVLLSGEGQNASVDNLGRQVAVWDWAEVSIQMTAPNHGGTYTSYWRMADGDGHMFGATLTLSFIVAEDPTPTP